MKMSTEDLVEEEEVGVVEGEWKTDTMMVASEIGDKMIRV